MSSAWRDWHTKKQGIVEPEIPALEQLLQSRSKRVLDIGCGTGRHVLYLARNGFEVYGFDNDQESIAVARESLEREGLSADLRTIDMTNTLPYQSSFFDAVLAVRVIHHTYTSTITKIVNEIDRVLVARGFLFLQVPSFETETFDPGTIWAEPGTLIARGGPEMGVPHHFFKKNQLLDLFPEYSVNMVHSKSEHYGGYCLMAQKRG